MADQSTKDEGDSGSHERVALDLMKYIRTYSSDADKLKTTEDILALYRKCRGATFKTT